ncbi:lysophospholipid acyltransferase family protein [Streptomyces sp. NPDC048641]|uniref:lysophospholipid acyltransferase family protein n=1 Tax=unclassified Streptomyces TaxID=2593676 RepID=UPI00342723B5
MSAWLPSAPCTPQSCAQADGAVAGAPRAVLRLLVLVFVTALGVALTPVVGRCPSRVRDALVRRWCRGLVRAVGVRVRITGAVVPAGGVLVVANHISWLDIPLTAVARPARMLAKREVASWPVAGPIAARGGTLFIERDRLRALPDTVARIADALRAGAAVAAFPEGSTWCGRAQGPFRRAVFQAALDAGVPVQPVRISYRTAGGALSTAPAFVGDDPLLASLWRIAVTRGTVAEMEVLPVIVPGGHPDRKSLTEEAETVIVRGGGFGGGPRIPHPTPGGDRAPVRAA